MAGSSAIETQLASYHDLVRKYHRTLDLVSDAALDRFPALIQQATAYADAIDRVGRLGSVLDVGSGVGLPGIVVAIALPHRSVLLVERRRRRATFLRIVVAQLGLGNARVSESDVRAVPRPVLPTVQTTRDPAGGASGSARDGDSVGFAVITAQAVSGLSDIYCLTRHLHADPVTLIARKGPSWRAEVDSVRDRTGATPAVRAEIPLPDSGTLVAIDVPGGLPCPPSG